MLIKRALTAFACSDPQLLFVVVVVAVCCGSLQYKVVVAVCCCCFVMLLRQPYAAHLFYVNLMSSSSIH